MSLNRRRQQKRRHGRDIKRRDLSPKGERQGTLYGGRRISDGIWNPVAGLMEEASKESGREKGHSAKFGGNHTVCQH